jgi:uncharacterized protein YjaZ
MPVDKVDVIVRHNPYATILNYAIGGYTPDAHTVYISLDAASITLALKELSHTLAHELHHTMRWRTVGYGETLGEALVTEGLAQVFEREVFGEVPYPWTNALTAEQSKELLQKARANFWQPYDHDAWFFGSAEIPHWAGYGLGYQLVKTYCEQHNLTASKLYDVEAKTILEGESV